MCGIVGIVGHEARVPADVLERATRSLAHRGPDDSGTIIIRGSAPSPTEIGFGNRRLAILDLSPLGHQPMQDRETGNWIVYNGELYNFRQIRAELEEQGVCFVSHTDTEVLLKAYAAWGERCLDRFRGMFAFAIWDAGQQRLFLARDPMGVKPLYYAQSGAYFLFASEVRTLLGTGLIPRRLDHAGLLNYLAFGSVYDPHTLVEGVSALPPGHSLTWERGSVRQSAHWDLVSGEDSGLEAPELGPVSNLERSRAAERLRPILEEAVRLQLVSDVPVGVFLSGGIDSSALVSALSRSGTHPSTFSLVFREADFSEAEYSRAVARKFRTNHHEITVSQRDAMEAIPDALRAMDQPTMDAVNTYFVAREARAAGIKVALSGLGGDEVFAGYSSFRTVPRLERFASLWNHLPHEVRAPLAQAFSSLLPATDKYRKLASLATSNGRLLHPYFLSRMLFPPRQRDLLAPSSRAAEDRAQASLRECLGHTRNLDPVNRVSYLETRCYMLNTLLRDADVMSMAHGLEVRVPLIDHRLARWVLALPGNWKINGAVPKALLTHALCDSLPEQVVCRPKRGFTLPFEHWLRGELRSEVEAALQEERISEGPLGGVLDAKQVWKVWQDFLRGATSWSRPWSLHVLQRWCELNLDVPRCVEDLQEMSA